MKSSDLASNTTKTYHREIKKRQRLKLIEMQLYNHVWQTKNRAILSIRMRTIKSR